MTEQDDLLPDDSSSDDDVEISDESHLAIRIRKTADNRFTASRRMEAHSGFGQWTIIILSIALLYFSALDLVGALDGYKINLIGVVQVTGSAFVLAYSILISMSKYDVRAKNHHQCAIELASIHKKMLLGIPSYNDEKIVDEYDNIIKRYENHEQIDFELNKINKYKKEYNYGNFKTAWTYIRYISNFLHYLITITVSITLILHISRVALTEHSSKSEGSTQTQNTEATPQGITTR